MKQNGTIAILGGGPAGSMCAAALAQRGLDVHLFEARAFPRDKVCGEFLSPAVTHLLKQTLGENTLKQAGATQIDHLRLFADGQLICDWQMPAKAWCLGRDKLDTLLLARAKNFGVHITQPAKVQAVRYEHDHVHLDFSNETFSADCVVHADGSGRLDPSGHVKNRTTVVGVKTHFRLRQPLGSTLELHGFSTRWGRGYFGLVMIDSQHATMGMVVDASLVQHAAGVLDDLWNLVGLAQNDATRSSDWLTCAVARSGYCRPGHLRSFRIGNAAAAVEPIGGEGIGLALWAGNLLGSNMMLDNLAFTQKQIASAYRSRVRFRKPICSASAWLLSRPQFLHVFGKILRTHPAWALKPIYQLTGKPTQLST